MFTTTLLFSSNNRAKYLPYHHDMQVIRYPLQLVKVVFECFDIPLIAVSTDTSNTREEYEEC